MSRSFSVVSTVKVSTSVHDWLLQYFNDWKFLYILHTHTHLFNGPLFGTTRVSRYQKGKTNLNFTEARVSGNGISWAICKSAPRSRQITMPAPHHSVFYRADALPAPQPTASKHWRQNFIYTKKVDINVMQTLQVTLLRRTLVSF